MKSGGPRNKIARKHGVIAFEREAAGVRDEIPCVIIKGVCDYADGHKGNETWRDFAAAMAASATRAFLEIYEQAEESTTEAFLENKEQAKRPTPTRTQQKWRLRLLYVSWLLDAHPKVSVFWVDASTAERFREAYHSIAKKHNIPGWDDNEAEILSLVKIWLEREYRVQWVMVVDGVERTESLFSQPGRASPTHTN
ncbi:hypothetical protein LX32DRAFT_681310 [Colletotrichum zoysiae]|uniref:Uncharacterized protein n=1 Tax=Colletotrichum zoysiae TaxID=1216348 RepID=A0AAD9M321_9PEZI|nr:hypothetical protein LX32DRAFT_681310 [Colletotrichum zoysiae]